jgi:molybdopterin biosynthesis enzyme
MDDAPSQATPRDDQEPIVPHDEASKAYVQGLVARGEAVRVAPGAPLPAGATHEIVGETETGLPIVKRRRYNAF